MNDHTVPPTRKGFSKTLVLLIGLVVVGAAGLTVVLGLQDGGGEEKTNIVTNTRTNASSNVNSAGKTNSAANGSNTNHGGTEGWETYTNRENAYSIQFPPDWTATTVTDEDTLDHDLGDAIIANGACGKTCDRANDFCELTISKEAGADAVGDDPKSYIAAQSYYKGVPISSLTFGTVPVLKTRVTVTPKYGDNGQGLGAYYLFRNGENYLSAYLTAGFEHSQCETQAELILDTLQLQ